MTELKHSRFENCTNVANAWREKLPHSRTPARIFPPWRKRREIRRGCMGVFAPENVPTLSDSHEENNFEHFPTLKPRKNQPSSERTGKTVDILLLRTSLYYRYYFAVHNAEKLMSKFRTSHEHGFWKSII